MTRGLSLVFLICCISACKKSKSVSQPQNPTPDSNLVVDPKPEDSVFRVTVMYYGESYDYSDCDNVRHTYYTDSMSVTFLKYPPSYYDTTIVFVGSRYLGTQSFKYTSQNKYNLEKPGKVSYLYELKGDSLYAGWCDLAGQCVESYTFKGKKKG